MNPDNNNPTSNSNPVPPAPSTSGPAPADDSGSQPISMPEPDSAPTVPDDAPAIDVASLTEPPQSDAPIVDDSVVSPTPDNAPSADVPSESSDAPSSDDTMPEPVAPEEPPIEPAAPVPGSIGSAISMPDDSPVTDTPTMPQSDAASPATDSQFSSNSDPAPASTMPTSTPMPDTSQAPIPAPAKKSAPILTIVLIIVAVIIVGVGVFMFIMMNNQSTQQGNNPSSTNPPETTTPAPTPSVRTLSCTLIQEAAESTPNLIGGTETISATYEDDALVSIESVSQWQYDNAEVATTALQEKTDSYNAAVQLTGLAQDPFSSDFQQDDATISIQHIANSSDIDIKSAALFGLMLDDAGSAPLVDYGSVQQATENRGFVCTETVN